MTRPFYFFSKVIIQDVSYKKQESGLSWGHFKYTLKNCPVLSRTTSKMLSNFFENVSR